MAKEEIKRYIIDIKEDEQLISTGNLDCLPSKLAAEKRKIIARYRSAGYYKLTVEER